MESQSVERRSARAGGQIVTTRVVHESPHLTTP